MRFKCPHCHLANDYKEQEYREIFIRCKSCGKDFRAAESSPLTFSADERDASNVMRRMIKVASSNPDEQLKRANVARINAEAAIYIKRGDYEKAEAELRKSLKQKPDQPQVVRLLQKITTLRRSV